jgi:hypothetical protein
MAMNRTLHCKKGVTELKSDDHRVLTSYMLSDDGNRQQFMTANY